jgi:fructose-1,6-bisphosphatase/inositol monophosphatase family enzyme
VAHFTAADLERLASALLQAGAEEIMPRFGSVTTLQARRKSSAFDIVTEADEAAERAITATLRSCFPGCLVIGEEAADRDPALLEGLRSAELCFLVDPLDGTKNFASGLPLFGLMVAAVLRGQVVAGVIHDPVAGTLALAHSGAGAWLQDRTGARTRMRVAAPVPVGDVEAIAGTNFLPEPLRSRVNVNLSRLRMSNWFRCAAHEYLLAAGGHCHVLFYNRLMPWDHAAGWLLHREAGGYCAQFDGSAWLPWHATGGLLYAPDQASWAAVRHALLE